MADKKEQILDAAKQLFDRQGYAKTSVDDISQAVGMRKSSLYYYFKNKEDLFMCSFRNDWHEKFKIFEAEANKENTPTRKILTYITQSLNYYEKVVIHHKIPVKSLIETRNLYRSFINKINRGGIEFYIEAINEGIENGDFKACEVNKVAESLFLIKFSIQYDQLSMFIHTYPTEADWTHIREQILFAISLVLDGIRR
ncbi:TetR/AcrR family transcriptional regulator [Reichenbachiella carrageenanivorans]|uniref:TetR/AcrR family transcriptional regulator n=1 Tax=Reichenbachiella carrageenanivorans TaxID=2979869 RepID=A0ABY6D4Y2_9BACT|nr:TetR/AcrR family transcriptional regulator [Reichenbachiella carrageenanivorans]UXX78905.1 TetR/AcrR family transcriptional regulator [Reichenbachiella carrageenanivorans]